MGHGSKCSVRLKFLGKKQEEISDLGLGRNYSGDNKGVFLSIFIFKE